jgi:hypothetical protein
MICPRDPVAAIYAPRARPLLIGGSVCELAELSAIAELDVGWGSVGEVSDRD